jgi:hypothetical protein
MNPIRIGSVVAESPKEIASILDIETTTNN